MSANDEANNLPLRFAAIQMVSGEDVDANMEKAHELVKEAAQKKASYVLLPENFAVFNAKVLYDWGEKEIQQYLSQQVLSWAKELGIWIVAGTLPQRLRPDGKTPVTGKRVRTSSKVFNPNGEIVARYDKIHLFDVDVADAHGSYRESEDIEPGIDPVLCNLASAKLPPLQLGLSVCYDLRFPELYRTLRSQGAHVITVPAAFTWETGRAHWEPLLRARAIENQCFVVAANQGGQHTPTRRTWGHSMIIDPWGEILASCDEGEAVIYADLDLTRLNMLRQQMPVQNHRVIK